MADFGKLNFSVSFNPTSAFPLDARCYFTSLALAKAAAATAEEAGSTNTVYYYGQKLLVDDGTTSKWYTIQRDGTLREDDGTPAFDLSALGLSTHTIGGSATTMVCDTTEIIAACNKGAVILDIPTNLGTLTLIETAHATNNVWEITGASYVESEGDESRWVDFSIKIAEGAISVRSMARTSTGTNTGSGGTSFTTDETLTLDANGVLKVNTTNKVEADNTLPITSAGVHTAVGNIEVLLDTI